MTTKKRILILNTGGTISCVPTNQGLEPTENYVGPVLASYPALRSPELPDYTIEECRPLIDSANMHPEVWNFLADRIYAHYDTVDGFVIFHGTDTMAYTASALSFMLQKLNKPIIFTGSQLPLSAPRSDALENIITALLFAASESIYEVCIYFNRKLLRANRARKLHTHRFAAFESPNYPLLAKVGIDIILRRDYLLPPSDQAMVCQKITPQSIALFRLVPGYCLKTLEILLTSPLRALILETYGIGNAPNEPSALLSLLESAIQKDIVVVNSTQCLTGAVDMSRYATGLALEQVGVLSALDMTPEALYCKLLYAGSYSEDPFVFKTLMQQNLCGERSNDSRA